MRRHPKRGQLVRLPKPARVSLPRWRAALDHPVIKTAVILFQLVAISVASGSAILAFQNLAQAQRLAAYQLVATSTASATAKWQAMNSILMSVGAIQSVTMGCTVQVSDTFAFDDGVPACGYTDDVELKGASTVPWEITDLDMHLTGLRFGVIRDVNFVRGDFSGAVFNWVTMQGVYFSRANLRGAQFNNPMSASQYEENISSEVPPRSRTLWMEKSDLTGALIGDDNLQALYIGASDISDINVWSSRGLQRPEVSNNYYRKGFPPRFNNEVATDLAEFVCDTPSGQFIPFPAKDQRCTWTD
jgi:uncharacterized protein YjbI with pentapeptide repeats